VGGVLEGDWNIGCPVSGPLGVIALVLMWKRVFHVRCLGRVLTASGAVCFLTILRAPTREPVDSLFQPPHSHMHHSNRRSTTRQQDSDDSTLPVSFPLRDH
jgi:hypothetical protein